MNTKILIAFILLTALFIGCNKESYESVDCYEYDYSDCDTEEPTEGNIRIELTINKANPNVEVVVFNGYPENKDTFTTANVSNPKLEVVVPLNNYYSIQAKYNVDGSIVYVTDGNEIESYYYRRCDSICWNIKGYNMDARLKYDNI